MKDLELMADDAEELKQLMDEESERPTLDASIWMVRKDQGLSLLDTTDFTVAELRQELFRLTKPREVLTREEMYAEMTHLEMMTELRN